MYQFLTNENGKAILAMKIPNILMSSRNMIKPSSCQVSTKMQAVGICTSPFELSRRNFLSVRKPDHWQCPGLATKGSLNS